MKKKDNHSKTFTNKDQRVKIITIKHLLKSIWTNKETIQ